MNWKLYSFVIRSKKRKDILLSLEKVRTPTEIGNKVKTSVSHVSRTLSDFQDKGIVECVTPEQKVGRVYRLTKNGKEILDYLKKERGKA
ncbi:MAG: transcriptional regulator [Candidatus Aenigmarchaeota archaeon CG_4_10_14_0_8_um_filter_37_24]|nr:ArsR family transcriptional regulator [Candidatus Aenigmarchaeota archaeon]OIN87781.1 MAG: transcriptional regulator [Candidatus Aenigmarchaeota archaeon CG1_02_38_14]PIV68554.1 MAG: transcriptional regulator [Candidatus Aenigmarchaeota archaeon CG01_land_8_20_14_3_00_37_9]PIW41382.1 MAG: transcriptional regulator [Candidatus Aenigmarchaeota archaeon CG15_BIG_FIL_POST_REV_8_21_14_020_37_27]PIX50477.1 MAG: transcriptional regulator [Candidatus Aenigmarchaeota archaeon CG_4_8_14_3_um_filter_37